MTRLEATIRTAAAYERISNGPTAFALAFYAALFASFAVRVVLHVCIGFGAVATAGLSAWWGLPATLVSVVTLGNAWAWWRRDRRVKVAEEAAELAEKQASGAKP